MRDRVNSNLSTPIRGAPFQLSRDDHPFSTRTCAAFQYLPCRRGRDRTPAVRSLLSQNFVEKSERAAQDEIKPITSIFKPYINFCLPLEDRLLAEFNYSSHINWQCGTKIVLDARLIRMHIIFCCVYTRPAEVTTGGS